MYDLVLDSEVFIANFGRSNPAFMSLERLCKAGVVRLHVPYLVKEEFVTHYANEKKNILIKCLVQMKKLDRSHFKELLNLSNTISTLNDNQDKMQEYLRSKFVNWLREMRFVECCISETDSKSVFEGYKYSVQYLWFVLLGEDFKATSLT